MTPVGAPNAAPTGKFRRDPEARYAKTKDAFWARVDEVIGVGLKLISTDACGRAVHRSGPSTTLKRDCKS
jgi:hypothetical protein